MLIPFHVEKVAQATAVLLKTEEPHRMSRLRVLKLLYIADRERLQECGRPITGDSPIAMDHGPVLSKTYDLIKGQDILTPQWEQYLHTVGRDVVLVSDPGIGKLTRKEIAKLQDVAMRFEHDDDYEIAMYTHAFAEWVKNKPAAKSSRRIPIEDLLEAIGLSALKDQLLADAANEQVVDDLLGTATPP